MSLFGKKTPVAWMPTGILRPDQTIFLGEIIHESRMKFDDKGGYQWLHIRLGEELHELLTGEILAHLPAKHHKEFLQMTAEHKSNDDIDRFLEKKMPNAKQVLTEWLIPLSPTAQWVVASGSAAW